MRPSEVQTDAEQQLAIDRFFSGNTALYMAFRQSCLAQFPRDIEAFEQAEQSTDLAAMLRITHNLHAALTMLGCRVQRQHARDTEMAASTGAMVTARWAWSALREELLYLVKLG